MKKKTPQDKKFSVEIISLLLLVVSFFIFYFPVFRGKIPVPVDALVGLYNPWRDYYAQDYPRGIPYKNFLITDPVRQQIPWRKLAIDEWRSGKIPVMNQTAFLGSPLLGNIQSGAFYPLNIVFFLFSFQHAWTFLILSETVLLLLFMYLFLRSEGLSPLASSLGSICFSYSGFIVAWLTWGTIVHTALWLPVLLLTAKTVMRNGNGRKRFLSLLAFGFSLFCSLTAGHSQIFLYVFLTTVAYILWLFVEKDEQKNNKIVFTEKVRGALLLGVISFLFLLPAVPLLKEFIVAFGSSSRLVDINYGKEGFFIPWEHALQFLIPDFFGNPATLNYWGKWNYGEFVGFIGVAPFVLFLYGILGRKKSFWHGILLLSVIFAFPSFLSYLPFTLKIPILSNLQPTRLLFLLDFSLAIFAAKGIDRVLAERESKKPHILFALIALLYIITFVLLLFVLPKIFPNLIESFSIAKRNSIFPFVILLISWAIIVGLKGIKNKTNFLLIVFLSVTIFDLYRFATKFTPFTTPEYFFPETRIIHFLLEQPKPFRILTTDDKILPPNTAAYFGIETVGGYDPVYSSKVESFLASYERGTPSINGPFGFNRIITPKQINQQLLPLLNVRYVLSLSDIQDPTLHFVMKEGETRLYEYTKFLPRAYFVSTVKKVENDQNEIETLYTIPVDTTATVRTPIAIPAGAAGTAKIVEYHPESLKIAVDIKAPQLLVVSIASIPGWEAEIDGVKAELLPVDFVFQGVLVQPGQHTIMIHYD